MSTQLLQNLGLSHQEAEIYLLLLKYGESPVQKIVKESKLKRTTVYAILNGLEQNGLVTKKDILKKIHFKPVSPSKLVDIVEQESQKVAQTKSNLNAMLPHMNSLFLTSVEQPVVRMFEGIEGLKEIYKDILKDSKPGFSVLQEDDMDKELEEWVVTVFSKKRAQKKMPLKVIITSNKHVEQFQKNDAKYFRFSKVVPAHLFPFQHEVTIYGDKVAFINYKKGDTKLGMVVKHPYFAQTMKAFFDLAWNGSDMYKRG